MGGPTIKIVRHDVHICVEKHLELVIITLNCGIKPCGQQNWRKNKVVVFDDQTHPESAEESGVECWYVFLPYSTGQYLAHQCKTKAIEIIRSKAYS